MRAEFDRRKGDIAARRSARRFRRVQGEARRREALLVATRKSSQMALEVINPVVPETVGGSADLTGSNNTKTATLKGASRADTAGRYIYYGIREHGMAAAMNGMALHGGLHPLWRHLHGVHRLLPPLDPPVGMMGVRVIYVMTHDSIGLGEDGPTHQPVEHLAALRAIPNLLVLRPADAVETLECWQIALEAKHTPSVILALTRQNLPARCAPRVTTRTCRAKGAYVILAGDDADAVIFATGSEVQSRSPPGDLLAQEGHFRRRGLGALDGVVRGAGRELPARSSARDGTIRVASRRRSAGWERWLGDRRAASSA
jgi:transketolase